MLRLHAITLTDFAPYKGEQRIEFRPEPGVTLITGDNGRGKTWLLNAIRFALFGHVLGRTDETRDLSRIANWETTRETGVAAFKVVLEFQHDGVDYRLTRRFDAAALGPRPEVLLVKGTSVLTQEETARELDRVLPEQIARFFLFDGELLRQYEELALDPSRGEELKIAIERILEIPILTNARTDITEVIGRINRALAQAAASNVQTEQLGVSLRAAQDLLDQHNSSMTQLIENLDQLEHERSDLEEQMSRTERVRALLAQRDGLLAERTRTERELETASASLRLESAGLWRLLLGPTIDDQIARVDTDLGALNERRLHAAEARLSAGQRATAAERGECPVCGQHLTAEVRARLQEDLEAQPGTEDSAEAVQRLMNRRADLLAMRSLDGVRPIAELERRTDELRVRRSDLNAELEALQESIEAAPEEELRALALRLSNVLTSLENTRARREESEAAITAQEDAIRQLRERLARAGGQTQAHLQRKADTLANLAELFREAIDRYRERLRLEVETEATRLFRLLRTEQDYDRLTINAGYGLTIVHQDGQPIVDRSAGYEHIVALSLLGALQRCAPITGPVIMDSPFGRLDPDHKARVVGSLPEISDQVILLAYRNEFDREEAARALGPRLQAEKELVRVSARHTDIVDRRAP